MRRVWNGRKQRSVVTRARIQIAIGYLDRICAALEQCRYPSRLSSPWIIYPILAAISICTPMRIPQTFQILSRGGFMPQSLRAAGETGWQVNGIS